MEPKVMELWFRWFVFFQFGDFGDFSSPSFSRENNPSCRLAKTNLQGRKGILVSFEEIDSCTGINVAGFYIVGTHNFSRIFRGFFVPINIGGLKPLMGFMGAWDPRVFLQFFSPQKLTWIFRNLRCQSVDDFRKSCRAVLRWFRNPAFTSLRW